MKQRIVETMRFTVYQRKAKKNSILVLESYLLQMMMMGMILQLEDPLLILLTMMMNCQQVKICARRHLLVDRDRIETAVEA